MAGHLDKRSVWTGPCGQCQGSLLTSADSRSHLCLSLEGSRRPPAFHVTGGHSPGMESEGSIVTRTEVSMCSEPRTTWHTYSPESAGDTWCSRSREPWVCAQTGWGQLAEGWKNPHPIPPADWWLWGLLYLVPGREAAPTLAPCHLGLSGHHTIQIQGLPLGHIGRGGLNADGLGAASGWAQRDWSEAWA
jgi:hypothetical protein